MAISFPIIEAGTPKKLIKLARLCSAKQKRLGRVGRANHKNATNQLLEANSSRE
jgi:hypothetical protein